MQCPAPSLEKVVENCNRKNRVYNLYWKYSHLSLLLLFGRTRIYHRKYQNKKLIKYKRQNLIKQGEYTTSQKRFGRKIPKRIFTNKKVVEIKRDGFRKRGGKGGGAR